MNISEGLDKAFANVGQYFGSRGFLPSKKKDRYIREVDGIIDAFSLRLSKKSNGQLWHHLTMEFENVEVNQLFYRIEKQARDSLGLEDIGVRRPTCSVTDWKFLLDVSSQASKKCLWFAKFEAIFSDDFDSAGYKDMIDAGVRWFEKVHHVDGLVDYCLSARTTHSLQNCLAAIRIYRPNELESVFHRILNENKEYFGWDQDEFVAFYNFLLKDL